MSSSWTRRSGEPGGMVGVSETTELPIDSVPSPNKLGASTESLRRLLTEFRNASRVCQYAFLGASFNLSLLTCGR